MSRLQNLPFELQKSFSNHSVLKVITGLNNFDHNLVEQVARSASVGGADLLDIACDPELVRAATDISDIPICVSSVKPNSFPEALKAEHEFEKVRKNSKGYLLANMTEFGKSKLLDKNQLENLGYNLVIYPVTTQRLAMQNVEVGLKSIFKDGDQNNIIDKMQTRKRLYELVEYEKYNTPGKKITDFSTEGHE